MNSTKTKQVIVMRKDLNMRKGKMVAQGSHASLSAFLKHGRKDKDSFHIKEFSDPLQDWLSGSFKKVCVYVNSEEELMKVYDHATRMGLVTALITDAGHTEFNGVPTKTCLAIGPEFNDKVDIVTGHLPLL